MAKTQNILAQENRSEKTLFQELQELESIANKEVRRHLSRMFEAMSEEEKVLFLDELRTYIQEEAKKAADNGIRAAYAKRVEGQQDKRDILFRLMGIGKDKEKNNEQE